MKPSTPPLAVLQSHHHRKDGDGSFSSLLIFSYIFVHFGCTLLPHPVDMPPSVQLWSWLVGMSVIFLTHHCWCLQVEQSKVLIKEGGVQLLLTIVDTPGFGDAVDNSGWWVGSSSFNPLPFSLIPAVLHAMTFIPQLEVGDGLYWQQVWRLPQRRVAGQQAADARQQSTLLPVLYCSVRTWVGTFFNLQDQILQMWGVDVFRLKKRWMKESLSLRSALLVL